MAKTMTPSESITQGQIGKIQELLGAALRKSGLPSGPVQEVLERQGDSLVAKLMKVVRTRVKANRDMIVRRVKVGRSKTPQQMIDATDHLQNTNDDVVKSMPKGERNEGYVFFFKPDLSGRGGYISDEGLEKEFALRGLKPCDPYKLAKVNADDPAFSDDHPNATHWKDESGNWCFASFLRWGDVRYVSVDRNDNGWDDDLWFAGLRK